MRSAVACRLDVLGRPTLLHPLLIVSDRMDRQIAKHPGMTESTQLSTGDFIPARLRRLKPGWNLAARNSILFQAQIRQEKAVDHVLGPQGHPHDLIDGDVQLIF